MRARIVQFFSARWARPAALGVAVACLAAAAASYGAAPGSGVSKVRFGGDQGETRVVIEMDRPAQGRLTASGDDLRVQIDLQGAAVVGALEGRGQGLVSAYRVDGTGAAARIRLDLTRPAQVRRRFLLPPGEGVGVYRYVLDLQAATPVQAAPAAGPDAVHTLLVNAGLSGTAMAPAPVAVQAQKPLRMKKVVVIDAGHGGKDPGALGAISQEKALTLAAAKTLKQRLERTGRYRVVLTRESDVYVPLESRVQIARRADADLFISLHADAGHNASTRGATVYTLSDKGSDRVARNIIAKNNWFIDVSLPGQDRAVNQILLDLTQRATKNRSAAFAEVVLERIGRHVPLLRRSHRDAGFVVLLAPDVPAILLELGFITNRDDEAFLNNPGHRTRLMDAVADSIDTYFQGQERGRTLAALDTGRGGVAAR